MVKQTKRAFISETSDREFPPVILKWKLLAKDYFSNYNFSPEKAGRDLFDHLGIDPYGGLLRCDKISKITYGKKTLFEKGEES